MVPVFFGERRLTRACVSKPKKILEAGALRIALRSGWGNSARAKPEHSLATTTEFRPDKCGGLHVRRQHADHREFGSAHQFLARFRWRPAPRVEQQRAAGA